MTTKRATRLGLFLVALTALGSSCRAVNYLYYVEPETGRARAFEHPVKEMTGNNKLDVLWVIDNSGSMAKHQKSVIDNTQQFMRLFTQKPKLKWKMGLISTDPANVPFVGFSPDTVLDWQTVDPVPTFQEAVKRLGIQGDGKEMMFLPVMQALSTHSDFLRPGSILNIIVITDAPEQSGIKGELFLKFLAELAGVEDQVKIYGIVGPKDFGCKATDAPWKYEGSDYEYVIERTDGRAFPLCDKDFYQHLMEIGELIVNQQSFSSLPFPDDARPEPSSIRVFFHGQELRAGLKESGGFWIYDYRSNSLHFNDLDFATDDNESVRVEYLIK